MKIKCSVQSENVKQVIKNIGIKHLDVSYLKCSKPLEIKYYEYTSLAEIVMKFNSIFRNTSVFPETLIVP